MDSKLRRAFELSVIENRSVEITLAMRSKAAKRDPFRYLIGELNDLGLWYIRKYEASGKHVLKGKVPRDYATRRGPILPSDWEPGWKKWRLVVTPKAV